MRLDDFDRIRAGNDIRAVTVVEDVASSKQFELTLRGPSQLVEEMLADAAVDLEIDSSRGEADITAKFDAVKSAHRGAAWEMAGLHDLDALVKPPPPAPNRASSVFASARPVSGHGTPFMFSISGMFVPRGASLFFIGSWVGAAFGSVAPTSGDQDLFLRLLTPTGPIVSASTMPGPRIDVVAFTMLVFPFLPVFQVFGFTAGVCSSLVVAGA